MFHRVIIVYIRRRAHGLNTRVTLVTLDSQRVTTTLVTYVSLGREAAERTASRFLRAWSLDNRIKNPDLGVAKRHGLNLIYMKLFVDLDANPDDENSENALLLRDLVIGVY